MADIAETGQRFEVGPLEVHVSANGVLRMGRARLAWPGTVGDAGQPAQLRVEPHPNGLAVTTDLVLGEVRALPDEPVVGQRFAARTPIDGSRTADFARPSVAWHVDPGARSAGGAPDGMRAFGHQYTEFALPVFSDAARSRWRLWPFRPPVVMPLGLIAPRWAHDGARAAALVPRAGDRRPGRQRTCEHRLAAGLARRHRPSRRRVRDRACGHRRRRAPRLLCTVGEVLANGVGRRRAGAGHRCARNATVVLDRQRRAYWYRTEPGLDAASSIVAAVDDLEGRGMPVGAVQLDSWWYPHEVLRPFDTDEWVVPPTGMVRWEPRDDVLPDGIAMLRERLDRRPLVAHCRHLSAQSPYRDEFPMWVDGDRAHPQSQDDELYQRLFDQAVAWGVEVFEHDWLIECFLCVRELRAPGRAAAWQEGIDAARGVRDLHAQWCMASPADFAQATRLRNVTSIRTSGDPGYLVGPEVLWAGFLRTNVITRALGLRPYKDVFHSASSSPTRDVEA